MVGEAMNNRLAYTKARETHYPERVGVHSCPITGDWDVWQCPECAYRIQFSREGRDPIELHPGDKLTQEQADRSIQLRKQGKHGEANALVASVGAAHKCTTGGIGGMSVRAS